MKRQNSRAYRILWDVHAWAGVVFALFLFVIFFTGAFVLFRDELHLWSDPSATVFPREGETMGQTIGAVLAQAPDAPWRFNFADDGRSLTGVQGDGWFRVDGESLALVPERSNVERILFYLHFFFQLPFGFYFTGLVGMALVLLLITGLYIQWRHLPEQLFRFRPGTAARILWTDTHKVLGILGLPFHVLFAFTGAMICLTPLLFMAHAGPTFGGDRAAMSKASARLAAKQVPAGRPAIGHDYDRVLSVAQREIPGFEPTSLRVTNARDDDAMAQLYGYAEGLTGFAGIAIRVRDGEVLDKMAPGARGPSADVAAAILGLHFVKYGGALMRWIHAFLSLAAGAMAISGVAIWLSKRRQTALLKLTIASSVGLAAATAVLFATNRLLPMDLANRPLWENVAFFGGWLCMAAYTFASRDATFATTRLFHLAGAASLIAAGADYFVAPPAETIGVTIALVVLGLSYVWTGLRIGGRARLGPLPPAQGAS